MSIEKKTFTCISCPLGCELTVTVNDGSMPEVTGNKCPRGEIYGREEVLSPKRMVTATVASTSISFPRVPLRTSEAIGREHIIPLLNTLSAMAVDLPVNCGDVLVSNFAETGVDVLITRSLSGD